MSSIYSNFAARVMGKDIHNRGPLSTLSPHRLKANISMYDRGISFLYQEASLGTAAQLTKTLISNIYIYILR
jgi:hypothetical protein